MTFKIGDFNNQSIYCQFFKNRKIITFRNDCQLPFDLMIVVFAYKTDNFNIIANSIK